MWSRQPSEATVLSCSAISKDSLKRLRKKEASPAAVATPRPWQPLVAQHIEIALCLLRRGIEN